MAKTLTIRNPDMTPLVTKVLSTTQAWNYLGAGLGAHLFDVGGGKWALRITNGVYNAPTSSTLGPFGRNSGSVAIGGIDLVSTDGDLNFWPHKHWARIAGLPTTSLRVGAITDMDSDDYQRVQNCLPVRCSYTIDFSIGATAYTTIYTRPPDATACILGLDTAHPITVAFQSIAATTNNARWGDTWLTALENGSLAETARIIEAPIGIWHWIQGALPYPSGQAGIEALGGWEQDSKTAIMRHRLTMNCSHIDVIDYQSGSPASSIVTNSGSAIYSMERGLIAPTTFPYFHVAHSGGSPDYVPKTLNFDHTTVGSSGVYEFEKLHGYSYGSPMSAPKRSHLGLLLLPAYAASRFWADPVARFDRAMIAAEARWTMPATQNLNLVIPGQGSTSVGTRSWAWGVRALQCSTRGSDRLLGNAHAREFTLRQMANGQCQRLNSVDGAPNSPNPWVQGWLLTATEGCQMQESIFSAVALADAGHWGAIYKMARAILFRRPGNAAPIISVSNGDVPKWVGVGDVGGLPSNVIRQFGGGADVDEYTLPALMAWYSIQMGQDYDQWLEPSLYMTVPNLSDPQYGTNDSLATKKAKWVQRNYDETNNLGSWPTYISHQWALMSAMEYGA